MISRALALALLSSLAAASSGCRGLLPFPPPASRLRVPQEMRRSEAKEAAPSPSPSPATLRIADGGRVYEVALPDDGSPVVVRVPLTSSETAIADGASTPAPAGSASSSVDAGQQAYLAALARIRALYGARRFELALLEVSALARQRPDDAKLWTMKGSLHKRLGQKGEAREAWERAQKLAPDDPEVSAALSDLSLEAGR